MDGRGAVGLPLKRRTPDTVAVSRSGNGGSPSRPDEVDELLLAALQFGHGPIVAEANKRQVEALRNLKVADGILLSAGVVDCLGSRALVAALEHKNGAVFRHGAAAFCVLAKKAPKAMLRMLADDALLASALQARAADLSYARKASKALDRLARCARDESFDVQALEHDLDGKVAEVLAALLHNHSADEKTARRCVRALCICRRLSGAFRFADLPDSWNVRPLLLAVLRAHAADLSIVRDCVEIYTAFFNPNYAVPAAADSVDCAAAAALCDVLGRHPDDAPLNRFCCFVLQGLSYLPAVSGTLPMAQVVEAATAVLERTTVTHAARAGAVQTVHAAVATLDQMAADASKSEVAVWPVEQLVAALTKEVLFFKRRLRLGGTAVLQEAAAATCAAGACGVLARLAEAQPQCHSLFLLRDDHDGDGDGDGDGDDDGGHSPVQTVAKVLSLIMSSFAGMRHRTRRTLCAKGSGQLVSHAVKVFHSLAATTSAGVADALQRAGVPRLLLTVIKMHADDEECASTALLACETLLRMSECVMTRARIAWLQPEIDAAWTAIESAGSGSEDSGWTPVAHSMAQLQVRLAAVEKRGFTTLGLHAAASLLLRDIGRVATPSRTSSAAAYSDRLDRADAAAAKAALRVFAELAACSHATAVQLRLRGLGNAGIAALQGPAVRHRKIAIAALRVLGALASAPGNQPALMKRGALQVAVSALGWHLRDAKVCAAACDVMEQLAFTAAVADPDAATRAAICLVAVMQGDSDRAAVRCAATALTGFAVTAPRSVGPHAPAARAAAMRWLSAVECDSALVHRGSVLLSCLAMLAQPEAASSAFNASTGSAGDAGAGAAAGAFCATRSSKTAASLAASAGCAAMLDLLALPRADLNAPAVAAALFAAAEGDVNTLQAFARPAGPGPAAGITLDWQALLHPAVSSGRADAVQVVLRRLEDTGSSGSAADLHAGCAAAAAVAFPLAAALGSTGTPGSASSPSRDSQRERLLEMLVDDWDAHGSPADSPTAFWLAAEQRDLASIERLLRWRDGCNAACGGCRDFPPRVRLCNSEFGDLEVLESILALPPSDARSDAGLQLDRDGAAVVQRLLLDCRPDPASAGVGVLEVAEREGRLSIVEALLADPRVDALDFAMQQTPNAFRPRQHRGRANAAGGSDDSSDGAGDDHTDDDDSYDDAISEPDRWSGLDDDSEMAGKRRGCARLVWRQPSVLHAFLSRHGDGAGDAALQLPHLLWPRTLTATDAAAMAAAAWRRRSAAVLAWWDARQ